MRKASRAMNAAFALEVLDKAPYVTVSFTRPDGRPYGVPLSLARTDETTFYFHCALEGEKMDCIAANPNVALSAVTRCTPTVGPKSETFVTVEQLLGPDGADYAPLFHEGTLTHTYLNYDDYHRYHFPVAGTVKSVYIIPHDDSVGGIVYWSDVLKRYVLESNYLSWQAYETRGCVIVETENYGLVAVLPIGMGQVSSVNWEPEVKVGYQAAKGAPLGYFLFGGSDCVLLFQKSAKFNHTAPAGGEGSYSHGFAHIYQGEQLGTIGQ